MSAPTQSEERLLIAASSFADAEAALKLARILARNKPIAFAGIFIDENPSEIALGASQRMVTLHGAMIAVPSPQQARLMARSESQAFRRLLSETAQGVSATWSFTETTGELVTGVCASARQVDVVLCGHRPLRRETGRVLLIAGPDTPAGPARALADALAREIGTDVVELGQDAVSKSDILLRADRAYASAVVADFASGPLTTETDLRRLIAAARCPVAVLGAGRLAQHPTGTDGGKPS